MEFAIKPMVNFRNQEIMSETGVSKLKAGLEETKKYGIPNVFDPAFSGFVVQLPEKLQDHLKTQLKRLVKRDEGMLSPNSSQRKLRRSSSSLEVDLEKQLQPWRENSSWVDQPPVIKVTTPKGSLCNLNVEVKVGLPPDAVYNIVTDPDNKRVFKNIKEVMSRRMLVDDGLRQVVEVEQAALWKFLWWSGTISVHVVVDQNREDHTMKFKQVKTGFMKNFEGCWKVEPMFVDEQLCDRFKPKTMEEYQSCTGRKGRIGSKVKLNQLIQPAMLPPPPISWYLRGITTKTTEMLIYDLLAEAARIREGFHTEKSYEKLVKASDETSKELHVENLCSIKDRWAAQRRNPHRCRRC